jgi:hypothetical protein
VCALCAAKRQHYNKSATLSSCTPESMHTVMLVAYNTDVDLCCTCCPALLPCMRHHLLFLGDPCFTTTAPGERWICMHWWNVSMQFSRLWHMPAVAANSSANTICWSHGKGFCSLSCLHSTELSTNLLNMQAGLSHAAHAHQAALC